MFDELRFSNDINKIKFIELSSASENNYVMLAIDGTVYKYDLASREMIFSFKTVSLILLNFFLQIVSFQSNEIV